MGRKKKETMRLWFIARFGERRGNELFLEWLRHKRKRNLEILKMIATFSWIGKLVNRI
jgi:hypothetical protein